MVDRMALKNWKSQTFQEARNLYLHNKMNADLVFIPCKNEENHWRDDGGVPKYHPGCIDETICRCIEDSLKLKDFLAFTQNLN